MKVHRDRFAVEAMSRVLEISVSGYYAWLRRPASRRRRRREELAGQVRQAYQKSRRIYGAPRVHRELLAEGEKVCRNTVAKIMRDQRIRSVTARRFVPCTTDSNHDHPILENRLNRDFVAESPNRKWCRDIT